MTFLDIFLFPFTMFEYIFSLMAWLFLVSWVMMTDWYFEVSQTISERYRQLRNRKKLQS